MLQEVVKRDGRKEPLIPSKLNQWGEWASKSLGKYVDWVSVVTQTVSTLPNTCTTKELQQALIKVCLDHNTWSYNRMAGRLYAALIYKDMYGDEIPSVKAVHMKLIKAGLMVELGYSDAEYDKINSFMKHNRDFELAHYQLEQVRKKYALRDKSKGTEYESCQFVYMRMAMALAADEDSVTKLEDVKVYYEQFSKGVINAPTPNYVNLGTPLRGYASCFPKGAIVNTSKGFKPIEDVEVGDTVVTHNNLWQKVYHTQSKPYSGKFCRVNTVATFTDEFVSTEDHRVYGIKGLKPSDIETRDTLIPREWIKADNLRVGDYVKLGYEVSVEVREDTIWDLVKDTINTEVSARYNNQYVLEKEVIHLPLDYKESGNAKQPDIKNISVFNKDMFRLFGYYLAEGCICNPSRGSKHLIFTFCKDELSYIEDTKDVLEKLGARVNVSTNLKDNTTKLTVYAKSLVELFNNIFGTGFDKKSLPSLIMKAPHELQEQLLVGLMRGDGCSNKEGFVLQLSNIPLIRQLKDICLRLKLSVSVSKKDVEGMGRSPFAVLKLRLSKDDELSKLIGKNLDTIKMRNVPSKGLIYLSDGAYARVKMLSSYHNDEEVYDLSVENDKSFTVSGIAVHNCCLHTTNDNAKSLAIGDHIAYTMTCMSAGIGAHINTRSMGDPVRNGTILHQGKLPYYRSLVAATKANLQSGRGGASTIYYPIFDPEVDVISRLKNPMSTEDKKIRGADYALQVNKFVVRKAAKNEDMFCFNSFTAPDLYEAFYSEDQELFAELYAKYEKRRNFKKVWFNPRDVIITVLNEGYETGRAYLHFVDEANTHTPFKESIYSSNLCNEIQLPTKGYSNMQDLYNPDFDGEGEIALCSLAAINVGKVKSEKDYEDAAYYSLKMIDKVIHLGEYVFPHLEKTAKSRLSAGIGITGLAEYMAQGKLSFSSPEGKRAMHELAERHAYYTIKASLRLAKEKGNAPWISKTKWSEGWLPIDTYNKNVDSVVDSTLLYDWENLRKGIISQGGIRNSVLIAHMPTESSSKASGATNGLYPIRDLNLMKTDNSNVIYWCASDGDRLAKHYELAWDVPSKDMIEMYSIFQKFCDQGISADMYRKILGADKVTSKEMLQDFFYMTKLGMKGRYYQNTATSNGTELIETEIEESGCADGVCKL